ncbi:MAG: ATP-binding cassette domain-containing protein [Methylobacteriaceae bacterium]|nr:ATP-binding cassette domain-containing protein [Methylobacteriaceae bacterium]
MIAIEALTKTLGGAAVLDGLSLTASQGQRIALIGQNGAGKTTLFRCLLGEYVYRGRIAIDGRDPRTERAAVLRDIAFVPQIAPRLVTPVGGLMRYVADVCGASVASMADVSRRLGLDPEEVARRPFVRLSGGMKQKLLIAMALGRRARLLILDEPAANLDPQARAGLFALLAERAQDATMIISSHRIDEIAGLVNRVVELDRGRIVLDDEIADAGALGSHFDVRLETVRDEPGFARAAAEWAMTEGPPRVWSGVISGPDRLRFLGFLARHAGLVGAMRLDAARREKADAPRVS